MKVLWIGGGASLVLILIIAAWYAIPPGLRYFNHEHDEAFYEGDDSGLRTVG